MKIIVDIIEMENDGKVPVQCSEITALLTANINLKLLHLA